MDGNAYVTRRQWLMVRVLAAFPDGNIFIAQEAVAATALAHPEWDMDEERTWDQWCFSEQDHEHVWAILGPDGKSPAKRAGWDNQGWEDGCVIRCTKCGGPWEAPERSEPNQEV